jgi:8-oxo-dGTP pyrophosphatase MutT (NUDIX family)
VGKHGFPSKNTIWDGTYYRVVNASQLETRSEVGLMQLGTIRYRYIATFPTLHRHHARCGLDPLYHLSTTALIRTIDGYYLFGKRARNGSIDLIGGGAHADELMISGGPNIEQNLYKEIHEEVGIWEDEIEELAGIGIVFSGTSNVLVIGHARAGLSKADAIARFGQRTENEMTEPIFVHEDKLRGFLRDMTRYRKLIPGLL